MATDDERMVTMAVPALLAVLTAAEDRAGRPLTEPEVLALRDEATCVMVPEQVAAAMALERGYDDISIDDCWHEWLRYRSS